MPPRETSRQRHLRLRHEILDGAIMDALLELLDEQIIIHAIDQALARLRDDEVGDLTRRPQIERELSLREAKIARLVDKIADGQSTPAIFDQLQEEEGRKKTLVQELDVLVNRRAMIPTGAGGLAQALAAEVADVKALLGRTTPQARQMLRKVLGSSRIRCTPIEQDGRRGYRFEGHLVYDRLLTGVARLPAPLLTLMVSGESPNGNDVSEPPAE
jgi:hypothetical protein